MVTETVIAAFKRLQTTIARKDAVEAITKELSPYEWRALHAMISTRSFQFDIIGKLPVELVAQIFVHLDPSVPYRLQRVSKQWLHVLRSPDVLKKSLDVWHNGKVDLQGAGYADCELKAQSVHAFRSGKAPSQYFKIKTYDPHGYTIMVEDTLIWSRVSQTDNAARMVYMFNIRAWTLHTLNGEAREKIHRLFASDDIVGFATDHNLVYVSTLDGRRRKKFSVPHHALIRSVSCRARTVACAGNLEDHALVFIWNYDSQQGRSFTISYNSHLFAYITVKVRYRDGLAVLVQPKDEQVIVFTDGQFSVHTGHEARPNAKSQATIRYSKFTYAGECIQESRFTVPDLAECHFHKLNNQLTPVSRHGTFRFNMTGDGRNICLQFDEEIFRFTQLGHMAQKECMLVDAPYFWWKDTFFCAVQPPDIPQSARHPILIHTGSIHEAQPKTLVSRIYDANDHDVNTSLQSIVLDNNFVVRALSNSFYVLCYGGSVQIPESSGTFFDIGTLDIQDPLATG